MRALKETGRFILAAWIVPAATMVVVFYGFVTNYSDVFSQPRFDTFYGEGIHRYRVLGRVLFLKVVAFLQWLPIEYSAPAPIWLFDPQATPEFYTAFLVFYIACTCIGCSALWWALRAKGSDISASGAAFAVVGVAWLQALGAWAMPPYDPPAFALLAVGIALAVRLGPVAARLPLAAVVATATLVRESAWFLIVFFVALHHASIRRRDPAALVTVGALTAAFAIPYAWLRVVYGMDGRGFYDGVIVSGNFTWLTVTSLSLLVGLAALLVMDARRVVACRWHLLLSVPYVAFVSVIAFPWEIRLWTPVLVPLLVLRFCDPPS